MCDKKISVVIPVMNEGPRIGECLKAVFKQTLRPFEVIVVDGHSKDNTIYEAMKYPVKIEYEDYHTRAGACKIGLENAKGEFIAFTDADCIPKIDWLESLAVKFDGENIVGVGGKIINIGEDLWEKSVNAAMDTFLGSANSVQCRNFKNERYIKSISGCNCLYKRTDLLNIGGFNVSLLTAEDTDINTKLLKNGKLVYTPDAVVFHNQKRGFKAFSKRMYQYGYGRAESRIWDLQMIPPIIALLLIPSLIFIKILFFIMISIYLVLIIVMAVKLAVLIDRNYLYMVPIVYLIEHISYSIGFWAGLFSLKRFSW